MKKALAIAVLAASCVLLFSCKPKAAQEKVYKIGVVQLVEHVALDASYKGFVDGLKEAGYEDGKNIKIDFQNAQGEQANCQTIAQKLINDQDDLILAIATPAAQAVANLTTSIPVLVTAVTDPATAKLVKSNEAPGTNVSGTSSFRASSSIHADCCIGVVLSRSPCTSSIGGFKPFRFMYQTGLTISYSWRSTAGPALKRIGIWIATTVCAAPASKSLNANRSTPCGEVRSLSPTSTAPLPTTRTSPPSTVAAASSRPWDQML